MAFDYSKLLGRIKEKYGTHGNFASAMGWSEKTTSLKLNNKKAWKQTEIVKACELLKISNKEICLYFFTL